VKKDIQYFASAVLGKSCASQLLHGIDGIAISKKRNPMFRDRFSLTGHFDLPTLLSQEGVFIKKSNALGLSKGVVLSYAGGKQMAMR